jgi:RNA polymerase sigma factor (sigma-70 family)
MDADFINWFAREILVHEPALTRFIGQTWIARNEVQDLRQEVYVKVLEAAERCRPTSPKSFLFVTARNLLIDRARKHRVIPIDFVQDFDPLNVLIDNVSPERSASSAQQLLCLAEAFDKLPARCREVVWLRKIENLSQKEIAKRLKIAEPTVETQLVRGMRVLTKLLVEEAETASEPGMKKTQHESHHGE